MIVGTAGHIDHGKTELIRALTGIETDRLAEEKERGISIDIGFAWLEVGGRRIGIVDVPGHERFIRNMLAGAHGIDLVVLVVAADDGVMPQTEEHLDIVHLLGTERGIVALTKVDLVSPERRRDVREEIEILVDGTALESAPVIEVSPISGEGIETLRMALLSEIEHFDEQPARGLFRMPIDRSFVIHGHGTVTTGTATAGEVEAEQRVRILPGAQSARVRGVQVHGSPVARAGRGQRIALNLAGLEASDVHRGQVVCDATLDRVTDRFDAFVELRPAARRPLIRHSAVRVHCGTAEVMAKILYLDGRDELAAKESAYVQLALREPIAAFGGDRFILREQTARATIGGGVIVYPFAEKPHKRRDPRLESLTKLHRSLAPRDRIDALLELQTSALVTTDTLAAAANLRVVDIHSLLRGDSDLIRFPQSDRPDAYATPARWDGFREQIGAQLDSFHAEHPRKPGMEVESLRSQVASDLATKIFRGVMTRLEEENVAIRHGSLARRPKHGVKIDDRHRGLAERVLAALDAAGFTPPDPQSLADQLAISPADLGICIDQLARENRAHRIDPKLIYSSATLDRAREIVSHYVEQHGEIDARALRDLIGASRKFSIALLTYFDRTGFTMRVGDVRKIRAKPARSDR